MEPTILPIKKAKGPAGTATATRTQTQANAQVHKAPKPAEKKSIAAFFQPPVSSTKKQAASSLPDHKLQTMPKAKPKAKPTAKEEKKSHTKVKLRDRVNPHGITVLENPKLGWERKVDPDGNEYLELAAKDMGDGVEHPPLRLFTHSTKAPVLEDGDRGILYRGDESFFTKLDQVMDKPFAEEMFHIMEAARITDKGHPMAKKPSRGPEQDSKAKAKYNRFTSKEERARIDQETVEHTGTVFVQIKVRTGNQTRGMAIFGRRPNIYRYSGTNLDPLLPHHINAEAAKALETARAQLATRFPHIDPCTWDYVLVNRYQPQDTIGIHSDKEDDLAERAVIVSLVLGGATRGFRIFLPENSPYRQSNDRLLATIYIPHNCVVLMRGDSQKWTQHAVLKATKEEQQVFGNNPLGNIRHNYTFRALTKNAAEHKEAKEKAK
jgi:alkylated DNA repair dioxygenase AlkB